MWASTVFRPSASQTSTRHSTCGRGRSVRISPSTAFRPRWRDPLQSRCRPHRGQGCDENPYARRTPLPLSHGATCRRCLALGCRCETCDGHPENRDNHALLKRVLDTTVYFVSGTLGRQCPLRTTRPQRNGTHPEDDAWSFSIEFAQRHTSPVAILFADDAVASAHHWENYWQEGGFCRLRPLHRPAGSRTGTPCHPVAICTGTKLGGCVIRRRKRASPTIRGTVVRTSKWSGGIRRTSPFGTANRLQPARSAGTTPCNPSPAKLPNVKASRVSAG